MTTLLGARLPDSCTPAADTQLRGDAPELHFHERSRYRAAAGHARRIYPGPLGELVFRELNAYAEFGHRFNDDGLIPRLATSVLATRSDHAHNHHKTGS
jgi:hypothetical protein